MTGETPKSREIKRLTTPLKFKKFKAYDCEGNQIKCSETFSDVRFTIEPVEASLTPDEILQYAPDSKAASQIRLKRGVGDNKDLFIVHESVPWILGLYYTVLFCIASHVVFIKNTTAMYAVLVLVIIPLIYLFFIYNLNRYRRNKSVKVKKQKKETVEFKQEEKETVEVKKESNDEYDLHSENELFKEYKKEIDNLNTVFNIKEDVVRKLIEKRFAPPQITYDRFISAVDNCHKLFYAQSDAALNIINLTNEYNPRLENEVNNKINVMKTIINQIEDLTNELIININSSEESSKEVKNLLYDMEDLIDSVKEY